MSVSELVKKGDVKVTLLRDGTMHGKKGDTVAVHADTAKLLCQVREKDFGGGHKEPYRLAKPHDEKDPPKLFESLTQGEARALGKVNRVETPKGPILPRGMQAGLPVPGDADYIEADGPNQKPRAAKAAKEPKPAKAKKGGKNGKAKAEESPASEEISNEEGAEDEAPPQQ